MNKDYPFETPNGAEKGNIYVGGPVCEKLNMCRGINQKKKYVGGSQKIQILNKPFIYSWTPYTISSFVSIPPLCRISNRIVLKHDENNNLNLQKQLFWKHSV